MGCNYSTINRNEHVDRMGEVWKKWSRNPAIQERYRNPDGTLNIELAKERLVDFAQYKLNLPFDQDFILSKGEIRRLNVEIDAYSKDLKGKFSEVWGIVPEGTSKLDPTSRKFYTKLNTILNRSRVNIGNKENSMADITSHFLDAYVKAGLDGRYLKIGVDAVNELRGLRKKAMEAPTAEVKQKFERAIEKFIDGDEGVFLKQFQLLSEMPNSEFKNIRKNLEYIDPSDPNIKRTYNPEIIEAAKKSRDYLDSMGKVFINGLVKMKDVVDLKFRNDAMGGRRLKEDIDIAIEGLKTSMETGGYFPGAFLKNLVDTKISLEKMLASSERSDLSVKAKEVSDILKDIPKLPDQVKGRNPNLRHIYDQDPLFVLSQYGKDAVSFNKLVWAQDAFLNAMRDIPKTDNTQFTKGLKKFLIEEYTVFTEGTTKRPDWVNNAVYYINAAQTARTMGLNVTGAVKNAASAIHYFSHVGPSAINRASLAYRHNSGGIREIVDRLENEAGYKFVDPASELFSEGLIGKADFASGSIEFDPISGKIKYNGTPIRDALAEAGKWSMGQLLTFHRMTENWQRRWMYKTSFIMKYQQLLKHDPALGEAKAEAFAKNYALEMVNAFAYEYAPHAKAKPLRGTGHEVKVDEMGDKVIMKRPIIGGMSEVAFHLLHYPMSLAETHLNAFRGAKKAIQARQWNADELAYAVRYGAVYSVTQLASVLLNLDLNNIFENETISRVKRLHDDLTVGGKYEIQDLLLPDYKSMGELSFEMMDQRDKLETTKPDKTKVVYPQDFIKSGRKKSTFGLTAEVFGPTVGTMKWMGIKTGLIDLDESTFNNVVFGNVDYSKEGEDTARYEAYQYSTEYGRFMNKTWPAVRDGRGMDLVRHWLGLYPRQWTKKYNQMIFGRQNKLRLKGLDPGAKAAVSVLDQMLEYEYTGAGLQ